MANFILTQDRYGHAFGVYRVNDGKQYLDLTGGDVRVVDYNSRTEILDSGNFIINGYDGPKYEMTKEGDLVETRTYIPEFNDQILQNGVFVADKATGDIYGINSRDSVWSKIKVTGEIINSDITDVNTEKLIGVATISATKYFLFVGGDETVKKVPVADASFNTANVTSLGVAATGVKFAWLNGSKIITVSQFPFVVRRYDLATQALEKTVNVDSVAQPSGDIPKMVISGNVMYYYDGGDLAKVDIEAETVVKMTIGTVERNIGDRKYNVTSGHVLAVDENNVVVVRGSKNRLGENYGNDLSVMIDPTGVIVHAWSLPYTNFDASPYYSTHFTQPTVYKITGTVEDGVGPVEGAWVSIINNVGAKVLNVKTDASGNYTLPCLTNTARKVLVVHPDGRSKVHDAVVPVVDAWTPTVYELPPAPPSNPEDFNLTGAANTSANFTL